MENNDFDLLEEFFIHHVHNFKIDKIDRFNHQKKIIYGVYPGHQVRFVHFRVSIYKLSYYLHPPFCFELSSPLLVN